jgi:hypothetical protein
MKDEWDLKSHFTILKAHTPSLKSRTEGRASKAFHPSSFILSVIARSDFARKPRGIACLRMADKDANKFIWPLSNKDVMRYYMKGTFN